MYSKAWKALHLVGWHQNSCLKLGSSYRTTGRALELSHRIWWRLLITHIWFGWLLWYFLTSTSFIINSTPCVGGPLRTRPGMSLWTIWVCQITVDEPFDVLRSFLSLAPLFGDTAGRVQSFCWHGGITLSCCYLFTPHTCPVDTHHQKTMIYFLPTQGNRQCLFSHDNGPGHRSLPRKGNDFPPALLLSLY